MFATGDAALPEKGMEMIPRQIARQIPSDRIHTGRRVDRVVENRVILEDGTQWHARAVVVATQGPEAQRLLNRPVSIDSAGETCIYFSTRQAPVKEPFLVLNGDGRGPVNNVAFPSMVSPAYAPRGRHLVSAVVLDQPPGADQPTESQVRSQMSDWFGPSAMEWDHLKTYRITHALPNQAPPTPDPTKSPPDIGGGIYVCGEYGGLPGIQWAMLSGRRAAEAVAAHLRQ
jgi:protoporphyrinogen oxidase